MQPASQNSDDHYVLIAPYIISLCLWKGRICENVCICVCANYTLPNDLVLDIPRGSCMWLLFTARELIGKPCLSNKDYTQTKTIRDQILARIQLLSEPKDNMHYIKKLIRSQIFTDKIWLLYYSGDMHHLLHTMHSMSETTYCHI